ncbi:asparagine synthase (glutamine-hydrolyzing) [Asanoa iriomotensis]|uniref:asparagine synthase (glutamine-hydrolyzing) n=1 Tax=Asanoa iriomotensis TaxID=234613 RepID=A0ABQ4C0U6_9ACTN|nr:asparagine synthase (glutamine-hydrolyzing) [Asanoa iriomotensis]GIF56408.1 asparagine synthetase B [Asanoa iriomotensis]
MCGITGWVDFHRDLRGESETTQAMTDTMACRGPDDEGTWIDVHVAFGHRRLAVIDIEGGRQPMVSPDGRVALTFSGEIYNFRELRTELEGRGHKFRTRSDTEVVLHAYLEWGEHLAERLNGMFALGIWDGHREELVLVRDRVGVKPLYYFPTMDGLLFASEPKAILAHPLADRTVDADGLREIFGGVKNPGASVLRGMPEVVPGHVLRVSRNGIVDRTYWQLTAREHTDDLETTVATVRELLTDIVDRQLISDVPLCTLLSGGLDSSTITALAARAIGERDAVRSFAVDFVDNIEDFQPDVVHPTHDAPYAQEVADLVGADHTHVVLGSAEMTQPAVREAVVRALDWPILIAGSGSMDISLYLLFQAIRQRSTVTLTGEAADELFGGYPWFHFKEYTQTGTLPWTLAHNLGFHSLFGPLLARIDLPGFQREAYRKAVEEVPRLPGETGQEMRMREFTYYFITRFMRTLLDRKDRLSMAVGLEVRVPYCDHRLIEYVYNTPWEMKSTGGREKGLLRSAVTDLLPKSVLERPKTGYPVSKDPAYGRIVREEFCKLLARDDAAVRPLLNPAVVRAVRQDPSSAAMLTGTEVDFALHLNTWIEMYDLKLDI